MIFNSVSGEPIKNTNDLDLTTNSTNNQSIYNGILRIYIIENISRWNMYDGRPYHNGFLDFAYEDSLSLEYLIPIENSITWKGDVTKENVFVIAAVFNPQVNIGYAYPPSSKPFDAYYIDACAKASPDKTGHNIRTNDITHTVFIEEGTGSWCKNCPSMADVLYNISKENEISFAIQGNIVLQRCSSLHPISRKR